MKMRESRKRGYGRSLEGKKGASNEEAKRKKKKRISAWKQTLHAVKTGCARTLDTGGACVCVVSLDVLYAPSEVIQEVPERNKHLKINPVSRHTAKESLQKAVYISIRTE